MSRVDVVTEAQTLRILTLLPFALTDEPLQGSVHIGVQSWVLPSRPRSGFLQVGLAVTRTRSVCTSSARSGLGFRKRIGWFS
jgi:hypothetical protein